jgi:3',5'-cyclic AMP phosphodiesterase CpdA
VPARLLHLSDLHVGTVEEPDVERALGSLIERVDPELIVASGDLTHRARPQRARPAAAFLTRLERPLLVVPGNHDIPWAFPGRFTHRSASSSGTGRRRSRPQATASSSSASTPCGRGGTSPAACAPGSCNEPPSCFAGAPGGALRVVVLHHHLIGAPWRSTQEAGRAAQATYSPRSSIAGAELILAGHIHQAAVSERHEFEVAPGSLRGATVSIAPGWGSRGPTVAAKPAACTSTKPTSTSSSSRPTSGGRTIGASQPCADSRAEASR